MNREITRKTKYTELKAWFVGKIMKNIKNTIFIVLFK